MDYPLYEELLRRKHPAAKWWLIGDRLYYLGLIPSCLSLSAVPVMAVAGLLGFGENYWRIFWLAVIAFPIAVVVFLIGGSLKAHAHKAAEREGIKWY